MVASRPVSPVRGVRGAALELEAGVAPREGRQGGPGFCFLPPPSLLPLPLLFVPLPLPLCPRLQGMQQTDTERTDLHQTLTPVRCLQLQVRGMREKPCHLLISWVDPDPGGKKKP
eukprot:Sspe_Gene.77072::Locus_48137_Transcript_1_1_Confidence_1.000_Length_850::g.77072::m.77072